MADENAMALIRTTVADEATAKQLAKRLVETGDAVCVHVHPMTSTYRWEGELVQEGEWMVEARALANLQEQCWLSMQRNHPYDVPLAEIVAETRVNGAYARWANAES